MEEIFEEQPLNHLFLIIYEDEIVKLRNALEKYSCKCEEPCALYHAEKEREDQMPHMMCGWWAASALK